MPSLSMMREVGATDFNTKTLDRALQERAADPKPTPEQIKTMEKGEAKQREIADFEKVSQDIVKPAGLPEGWTERQQKVYSAMGKKYPAYDDSNMVTRFGKFLEENGLKLAKVESLEDHIVANFAYEFKCARSEAYASLQVIAKANGKSVAEHFRTSKWGEGTVAMYRRPRTDDFYTAEERVISNYLVQDTDTGRLKGRRADMIVCDDLEEARRDAAAFLRALDN